MNDVPTLGRADLGGPPWERGLVARIRELHLAWRTEKIYRHWAWRLARFCAPKPAEELTHEEVRRWLSHLAVEGRVSVATQRQALNAAVFLFREVFKRDPGDFSDFVRSNKHRNVPSVLTREECDRLFAGLSGRDFSEGDSRSLGAGQVRQESHTPHVAAQFCYASAGKWNRHPRLTGFAGACGYFHDTDLSAHGETNGRRHTKSSGLTAEGHRYSVACVRGPTPRTVSFALV